jgi:hypothetical protein
MTLAARPIVASLLAASAVHAAASPTLDKVTKDERAAYLRRARVWEPTDVAAKDLLNGPKGKLAYAVDQKLTCDFVPKPLPGWTEKFLCRLPGGAVVKVKYVEGDRFKEVYGEVLGTRLFWALGFYADKVLPVRVTCRNCPKEPWKYINAWRHRNLDTLPPEAEVGTHTFDPASIEESLDVVPIEEHDHQGWGWTSLSEVDAAAGGATKAELDAFRLLNAFVQNADNGHEQNALACFRKDVAKDRAGRVTCRKPILYVDDLGAVLGRGGGTTRFEGRTDYDGWKERRVWRDPASCQARLDSIFSPFESSNLKDPTIGEGGRALLAKQLAKLSDRQIADLFRAARIDRLHQMTTDADGTSREVTLHDWVELFKAKRAEITEHPGCPTP